MSEIFEEQSDLYSLAAGETIAFGKPVMISSGGAVVAAANGLMIGIAVVDDIIGAQNDAEQYESGDMVLIRLDGPIQKLVAGGTFAEGEYVKLDASGDVVVEATATTRTVLTKGIALEAGSDTNQANIMRLK